MARMRLLDLVRPFLVALPEVELPYQKVDQMEKLVFTFCAGVLYLILAEVSVYSMPQTADPIPWLRAGLGMSHGTLAEFGVFPIILSGMGFQILAGLRKISVSLDVRSDRALFQSLQKIVALGISAFFSILLAVSFKVSTKSTAMIAAQLFFGGCSLVYIDEILSKGYGVITGTILFTAIRASQTFAWSLLSLESVPAAGRDGTITYGVIPSFFFNLTNRSLVYTVTDFVFRTGAPNLLDILVAVSVFFVTMYMSIVRLNLQIRSTRMRAQSSSFPIRLVYTGAQPVLFALSALASLLLASYALSNLLGPCSFTRILGVWDKETGLPLSGLAAYLTPRLGSSIAVSVIRVVIYTTLLTLVGGYIGNTWTQSSGFAPQDIAKTFKENSLVLVGKRDVSVVKELRRVIPLASTVGGLLLGLLVAVGDIINPNGWGSTMTIATLGLFGVFEQLASEGMVGPDAMQNLM